MKIILDVEYLNKVLATQFYKNAIDWYSHEKTGSVMGTTSPSTIVKLFSDKSLLIAAICSRVAFDIS